MEDLVLVEKAGGYGVVTLNRPHAMNALSAKLRNQLATAIDDLEADDNIRVMILTGAGEKAFTAGLDLKEMGAQDSDGPALAISSDDPVQALAKFSGPIIGAINGVAITGGFEIALACDVLIGTSNTRFADTHARVGILPGWGLSQKLMRLLGASRAKEVSLTGNFVSAEQALDWGLINHLVAPEALMDKARALADDMLSCVPETLRAYKALMDDGFDMNFGDGMALEQKRGREANRQVGAGDVEARREAVRQRGQEQK
ncbi:MAG: enoyl-CoA hydratase [Alphaproteobacteria bacterium]|nr:enoyl-CoA hydratase [Alphaproteobacteria bacterium]